MKSTDKVFDRIAQAITSLAAVIFVMLMTITGMVFFSHTLFQSVFPSEMTYWERIAAAWFMALGWESTVLITTVNSKHINKNIPAVMAVCSGIIVLFFIKAFDADQNWLTLLQRWFVGILAATINFIYADLFYAKFKERVSMMEAPMKLIEAQSRITELERQVNDGRSRLKMLDELHRFKKQVETELTCPHCQEPQKSYGTLHAHKRWCKQKATYNNNTTIQREGIRA